MTGDISYEFRSSIRTATVEYTVTDTAIVSSAGRSVLFSDIRAIRFYDVPGMRMATLRMSILPGRRCVISAKSGPAIVLTNQHVVARDRIEDRDASYRPLVAELVRRVRAANPRAKIHARMPAAILCLWWLVIVVEVFATVFGAAVFVIGLSSRPIPWATVALGLVLSVCTGLALRGAIGVVRRRPQAIEAP